MTKIRIAMGADTLRWALRAVLAAASKDDVTPVLTAVQWLITKGQIHLVATDRYRVHEVVLPAPKGARDGEFLMHRSQAAWILANSHKPARIYTDQAIEIVFEPSGDPAAAGRIGARVIASEDSDSPVFSYAAPAVKGNFPPVARLFPEVSEGDERVGAVGLDPLLVASLSHLSSHRHEPLIFTMPKTTEGKAKPIHVQNVQGTARALVQPNLLTRSEVWQGLAVEELAAPAEEKVA